MRHMSEYRGGDIAVTLREEAPMLWRAVIEVWPPVTGWRTSRPRIASFWQSAVSQGEILTAAKLHIEEWVDIARAESGPQVGEAAMAMYRKKINGRKGSMPSPFAIICPGGQL